MTHRPGVPKLAERPIRTIAFDWNGTLVDDATRLLDATNQVLVKRKVRALALAEFLDRFILPPEALLRHLGLAEAEISDAVGDWNAHIASLSAPPMAGAHKTLTALRARGLRLGVVSAAGLESVARDISLLAFSGVLDFIIGSAVPKRRFLRSLGDGAGTAYVGDTEYDIREARAAGAVAIAFGGGYRPRESLLRAHPDVVIDNLSELISLVSAPSASEIG